ncbi:hypothetical protein HU200_015006 [Digitaria exilis]|uniref:Uncharacterized protein n=1 Tax=Digitaria exilis TaxID=1010633 RepID=A0A835KLT4_9POAL|nr:hypothetical protein HU200_015006 [Digitaria exilis]
MTTTGEIHVVPVSGRGSVRGGRRGDGAHHGRHRERRQGALLVGGSIVSGGRVVTNPSPPPQNPQQLGLHMNLRAFNPSGRARMYYVNIRAYVFDKNTSASSSPTPEYDSIFYFKPDGIDVLQQEAVDSLMTAKMAKDQVTPPYYDMLYNGSSISDVTLRLDGELVTEVNSRLNETRPMTSYYCEQLLVGGDSDDLKGRQDLSVVGGSIVSGGRFVTEPPQPPEVGLAFNMNLRALNPSGRARMYYVNITAFLFGNNTSASASSTPEDDSIFYIKPHDIAVLQQETVDSLVTAKLTKEQVTPPRYYDMLYNGSSNAASATLNETRPMTSYYCEQLLVGGDSDDLKGRQDVICRQQRRS